MISEKPPSDSNAGESRDSISDFFREIQIEDYTHFISDTRDEWNDKGDKMFIHPSEKAYRFALSLAMVREASSYKKANGDQGGESLDNKGKSKLEEAFDQLHELWKDDEDIINLLEKEKGASGQEIGFLSPKNHLLPPINSQVELPDFDVPKKLFTYHPPENNQPKEAELSYQSNFWDSPNILDTFNLIVRARDCLNSGVSDLKVNDYVYLRDRRRELAQDNNNNLVTLFNIEFNELRKKWSSDPKIIPILEEEARDAVENQKPEYFMTPNSIIFLNTINGDLTTEETVEC